MERDTLKIGTIILAAGSSSRMGQSKQLLNIDGQPLLRHIAKIALEATPNDVIIVLGSKHEEHEKVINDLPVKTICNTEWQKGMGSSLKVGLTRLLELTPDADAVIILVCDQPMLTTSHIITLIQAFKNFKAPIIAMAYADTVGVPALFDKSLFASLLSLQDDQGAKKIIQKNLSTVHSLPFPEGVIDLDTPDDYLKFKQET